MRLYRIEHSRGQVDWIVAKDLVDATQSAVQLHGINVKSVEGRDSVIISNAVRKDIAEQHS